MASLSGVSSSNTVSSLMNSANMISGLASGLDTEGMIENLVKGYQTKISQLNQKITKTEWKQDAYRSISTKLVAFSNKYTSYTSSTNLMASGFFSNSVKVQTKGTYADKVSASGKTSSDISLNAVHQLAKAAQYRTKSTMSSGQAGVISGKAVDLSAGAEKNIELSNLTGSLTLTYGSKEVSINFNESTTAKEMADIKSKLEKDGKSAGTADVLAEYINQKLGDEEIVFNSGNSETADKRIKATANADGRIVFEEQGSGGNGVYISGASGNIAKQLGLSEEDLDNAENRKIAVIDTHGIQDADGNKGLTRKLNSVEYLAEKGAVKMNMSLNGSTKQITMPDVRIVKKDDGTNEYYLNGGQVDEKDFADKYAAALQSEVEKAFGGKVTVENKGADGKLQLEFSSSDSDELVINTDIGDALGIGNTATSYLNTSKTLKDLMGDKLNTVGNVTKDENGMPVLDEKTGKMQWDFTINGVKIGTYTEDTKLSDIMTDINANKDAGVSVAYSQTTQSFTFKAKETGADSQIKIEGGLAEAMFGSTKVEDQGGRKFSDAYKVYGLKDSMEITFSIDGEPATKKVDITKETTIDEVVNSLNTGLIGQSYTFAYDKSTGKIEATDKKSGAAAELNILDSWGDPIKFNESTAPKKIDYTEGQDAKFTVTVNGEQKTMTRSSNSVNIDGMTISMNEEFDGSVDEDGNKIVDKAGNPDYKNSVTFQSKTDSDKIIDTIKSMVADYNTMMSEVKSAYSTMPYQNSSGSFGNYEPLTDEDKEGMSESAIERYEEKAKQGILFGDQNLSGLYSKMFEAFSFTNSEDVDTLKDMGITVGYDISSGGQTVQLDEDKLRAMLDSEPDRVAELFTKEDGIMDRMKTGLDYYAKTVGEPKGVLIQQAGSPLSSLSLLNNTWQQQIDNYNTEIEKWQDKLTAQVEKYTSQFSRLEQLINQMNSQSSTLQGMMGG